MKVKITRLDNGAVEEYDGANIISISSHLRDGGIGIIFGIGDDLETPVVILDNIAKIEIEP